MKLTPVNPHFNACDQPWEWMPEQESGGRLCNACERVLVDFTPLTDQQMLNLHRTSETKLCGRYTREQIDRIHRHMVLQEAQSRPWLVSLAMGIGSAIPFTLAAQQPVQESLPEIMIGDTILSITTIVEEPAIDSSKIVVPIGNSVPLPGGLGQQYPILKQQLAIDTITIEGSVFDDETHEPLAGVRVMVAQSKMGTITDAEGRFQLKIPSNKLETGNTLHFLTINTTMPGYWFDRASFIYIDPNTFENPITVIFRLKAIKPPTVKTEMYLGRFTPSK